MDPDDTAPPEAPDTIPAPPMPLPLQAEQLGYLPDPTTDPLMRAYALNWDGFASEELDDQ
ncbi:MAG: hypothetical protein ACYDDA_04975 [Acidiferrobacteraceae bacterium]